MQIPTSRMCSTLYSTYGVQSSLIVHSGTLILKTTRTTCLQGPPVYKKQLSRRAPCPEGPPAPVYKDPTCLQGPTVYKDHLCTRTICLRGPPVYKDHLSTRTTCVQGPHINKNHLLRTTCIQGPPAFVC